MKKLWLCGIVALLALAAACTGVVGNDEKAAENAAVPKIVGKTDDGREIMEITISGVEAGGKGRALTDSLAQSKHNFFEVAFKNGAEVYRATWNKGYPATVRVPVSQGGQTYNGAENAILFAGRESDKTLLAVGIITNITDIVGGAPTDKTDGKITTSTTSVKFTLYPLLNKISDVDTDTTFKITGPDLSGSGGIDYGAATIETLTLTGGVVVPVFSVPENNASVIAEYSVSIGPDTNADGIADTDMTASYNQGIILNLDNTGYSPFEFLNSSLNESSVNIAIPAPAIAEADSSTPEASLFPANGTFSLTFDTTGASDGYAELSMGIRAYAISSDDSLVIWNIKGGLNKTVLDDIAPTGSKEGGAVLVKVGEPNVYNNVNIGNEF